MLMLALKLFLKDKSGGKQHCLIPSVGFNMVLRHFWKRWYIRKGCVTIEDWGFKKILCKACLLSNCFLVIKRILKALFSFIPWFLNFSDLPDYGSNSRKRYTLKLLSKCLMRSTLLLIKGKVPPALRYPLWFPIMF